MLNCVVSFLYPPPPSSFLLLFPPPSSSSFLLPPPTHSFPLFSFFFFFSFSFPPPPFFLKTAPCRQTCLERGSINKMLGQSCHAGFKKFGGMAFQAHSSFFFKSNLSGYCRIVFKGWVWELLNLATLSSRRELQRRRGGQGATKPRVTGDEESRKCVAEVLETFVFRTLKSMNEASSSSLSLSLSLSLSAFPSSASAAPSHSSGGRERESTCHFMQATSGIHT